MTHHFADLMFTPQVKRLQTEQGSRAAYSRFEEAGRGADQLSAAEAEFIARRDSFYMATVSEIGWPYVQHRGGPPGFLKVLDEQTLGFADFRGNKQYVTVGALASEQRVSVILVDYPNQRRLKLLGRARVLDAKDDPTLLARLHNDAYPAKVERGVTIALEAFDWNCPQHITPRYTQAELADLLAPVNERLKALEAENARLRGARPATS